MLAYPSLESRIDFQRMLNINVFQHITIPLSDNKLFHVDSSVSESGAPGCTG